MHLRLDLHSFLPSFTVVDTAAHHSNRRVHEVCAGVGKGEIVVFDKAYVDFDHLYLAHLSAWGHSFTRLFTVSRAVLWERIDLLDHLKSYGMASALLLDNIANRIERLAIATNEINKPDLSKIKVLKPLCQSYGMAVKFNLDALLIKHTGDLRSRG